MYGHWATVDLDSTVLTVTPFNLLPIERRIEPPPTPNEIKEKREEILKSIVNRMNYDLERDEKAMTLVSFALVAA